MKKEELTQKYVEFQLLNQQIQQSQQRLQMLAQQITELKSLSKNLSEISKVKAGSDMFTNLGVGVHLKSSVKDVKKLLVNVGAGIFVKKTPEETIKIVDKQAIELDKFCVELSKNLQISVERAESLRQEISEEKEK